MSYIDLHIHSSYSIDGEYSPIEIVDLCLNNQIQYFSIADHNSTKAVAIAKEYCKDKDIELIAAVELDCTFDGRVLHVLGYNIDHTNPMFDQLETDILGQEKKASKKRMQMVRDLGIEFSDEVIESLSIDGVVTGEMIGEAAIDFDKNKSNPLLKPYYEGGSRSDNPYVNFYWDFCSQGKEAYVEIHYISLKEAINIIKDSGGIPILAHPGNNVKEDKQLLESIIKQGIEGLEVYSTYHDKSQKDFYKKFALEKNLLSTCGSDFHGKTKPSIDIGSSDCEANEDIIIKVLLSARL